MHEFVLVCTIKTVSMCLKGMLHLQKIPRDTRTISGYKTYLGLAALTSSEPYPRDDVIVQLM